MSKSLILKKVLCCCDMSILDNNKIITLNESYGHVKAEMPSTKIKVRSGGEVSGRLFTIKHVRPER